MYPMKDPFCYELDCGRSKIEIPTGRSKAWRFYAAPGKQQAAHGAGSTQLSLYRHMGGFYEKRDLCYEPHEKELFLRLMFNR